MNTPEPGIYENVEFADYLAWDAVSNSRLSLAAKSLAHYRDNAGPESSKALRIGSLVHSGQLEPLELAKRYAVMPPFNRDDANVTTAGERSYAKTTKYYQAKEEEFRRANQGKELVEQDEYDRMIGICTMVGNDECARALLNSPGPIEVSLVWDDPVTGLRCKARIDKFNPAAGRIIDLKTYAPKPGGKHPIQKFCKRHHRLGVSPANGPLRGWCQSIDRC